MSTFVPVAFVKFCPKESYADDFLAGNLFMNTVGYFKRLEDADGVGRADPHEATTDWWQPSDIVMKLQIHGLGELTISGDDLAGPVATSDLSAESWHLFCMYVIGFSGFELVDGRIVCPPGRLPELQRQLKVDERCFQLGGYAVVVDRVKFMVRLRAVLLSQGRDARTSPVHYFDDNTFHGSIPEDEVGFWKRKCFSFQNEFRLRVVTGKVGNEPLRLALGDISEFCRKVRAEEVSGLIGLTSVPAETDGKSPIA